MDAISTEDWESRLGAQVRAVRIARLLDQAQLAERANITRGTLGALERGEGSSLSTLIKVARVLERTDWLNAFDPIGTAPSPMEQLRASRRQRPRPQRVPRSR